MKHGDLVGWSIRGGRCGGVTCDRGSVAWGTPPLIDEVWEGRVVGLGSSTHSGETCGSRMMPAVHSVLAFERCKLDGRLFFLDRDGFIRISGGIGVVGGVEKVSPSGDGGSVKAEGMVMVEGKERAGCLYVFGGLHRWLRSYHKQHLQTATSPIAVSPHPSNCHHQSP